MVWILIIDRRMHVAYGFVVLLKNCGWVRRSECRCVWGHCRVNTFVQGFACQTTMVLEILFMQRALPIAKAFFKGLNNLVDCIISLLGLVVFLLASVAYCACLSCTRLCIVRLVWVWEYRLSVIQICRMQYCKSFTCLCTGYEPRGTRQVVGVEQLRLPR